MKKFFLLTVLAIVSCQSDDDQVNISSNEQSFVDSSASFDGQPYIIDDAPKNNKVAGPPGGTPWTSVWFDNFDSTAKTTINTAKWTVKEDVTSKSLNLRDPNITWWGSKANMVWLENGKLILATKKVLNSGSTTKGSLYCSRVETNDKFERKFGYFEVYMDIQHAKFGAQTAFWFMSDTQGSIGGKGSDGVEIDVVETSWLNDVVHSTLHWDGYGAYKDGRGISWTAKDMNNGYHYWGLDWSRQALRIYYDGVHQQSFTGLEIPLVNEWILLSTAASFGNANTGFTKERVNNLVYHTYIDYVKVWDKNEPNYN